MTNSKIDIAKKNNAEIIPLKLIMQSDVSLAIAIKKVPLKDATNWEVLGDRDGECTIMTPAGKASARSIVGQMLSLLSCSKDIGRFCSDLYAIVILTSSSHYKKRRLVIAKDIGNNVYMEINGQLAALIPTGLFSKQCKAAMESGSVFLKPQHSNVSTLASIMLDVAVADVVLPIRLDHALALVKRHGSRDVYGETIIGAVPYYAAGVTKRPKWKLVYGINNDGSVSDKDFASIDHVSPKAKGGADKLVNMQLMRKIDNSVKGCDEFDSLADPTATMETLSILSDGILSAYEDDTKDIDPIFANEAMTLIRKEMKAAETTAKAFAKRYAKAADKIAKNISSVDENRTELKAEARRKARQAARQEKAEEELRKEKEAEKASEKTENNLDTDTLAQFERLLE